MITRADIQAVIGLEHGPSAVATILDWIRRDDPKAITLAARLVGAPVSFSLGVTYVARYPFVLARTHWEKWHVVPWTAVRRVEALGSIAILAAFTQRHHLHGMELNRLHVGAAGSHRSPTDTDRLLEAMVTDGEIEPADMAVDAWLHGMRPDAHKSTFQLGPGVVSAAA